MIPLYANAADIRLTQLEFNQLPGWGDQNLKAGIEAFKKSCARLATLPTDRQLGFAGEAGDWQDTCRKIARTPPYKARAFFEREFTPYQVKTGSKGTGLFTGYYQLALNGSRHYSTQFRYPIYAKPDALSDQPYYTRAEINRGVLKNKGLEIAYTNDPIALFFLQVQGSGWLHLKEGGVMHLAYAARNNQPYTSIGKILKERGELPPGQATAQGIQRWLKAHPKQAPAILEKNESYVFFREEKADLEGPLGAQGVELTPLGSLAVDKTIIPLGVPLWVDTLHPIEKTPFQRLMVAQDTGSAIKGAIRGDIFFGSGTEAEALAGHMQRDGRYYVLLPKGMRL